MTWKKYIWLIYNLRLQKEKWPNFGLLKKLIMCGKLVHSTMHQLHHIVIFWKSQYVVMKGLKSYVFTWRIQNLMLKVIALTFGEKIVTLIFGCCIDSKSLCCSLKNVVQQKHALCFMFLRIQPNLYFKIFELSFQESSPTFIFHFCWIWVLCVCIMHFLFFVCLPCLFHIIDPKEL
jgi:hypothetical protein